MKTKLGICQWRIPVIESQQGLIWALEKGIEGVSIDLGDDTQNYPLADKYTQINYMNWRLELGIEYPSIGVGVLCRYGMTEISNRELAKTAIGKGIEAAAALNIPVVQLPSFMNGDIRSPDGLVNTIDCLRFACDHAKDLKVLVETENTLSAEEQIKLIEDVASPNLRICFDTRNPFSKKRYEPAVLLEKLLPYVYEVHLKDGVDSHAHTELLGMGNSGFLDSFNVLKRHSYSGWLLLENDYQAMASLMGENLDKLVQSDVDFVKSLIRE